MNQLLSQPLLIPPVVTTGIAAGFLALGSVSYPNLAQAASLSNVSLTKTVNLTASSWSVASSSSGNSGASGANATLQLIANLPSVTDTDFFSAGASLDGSYYKLTGATISTSGLTFSINSNPTPVANFGANRPGTSLSLTSLTGKVGGVTGDPIFGNLLPSAKSTTSFSNTGPAGANVTRQKRATLSGITTTNPTSYLLPDSFDPYFGGGNNPGILIADFTETLRTLSTRNYNLALFSAGGNFTVTYDYTLVSVPEPGTAAALLGLPVLGLLLKRKQKQSDN
jgi:hypothetical protein